MNKSKESFLLEQRDFKCFATLDEAMDKIKFKTAGLRVYIESEDAHFYWKNDKKGFVQEQVTSGTEGEANTGQNIGEKGVGVFDRKDSTVLKFKTLVAKSNKVDVTDQGDGTIGVDINEDKVDHDDLHNAGDNTHKQIDEHITDKNNPHGVTAQDIGSSKPQWNANKINDKNIDNDREDGRVLRYNQSKDKYDHVALPNPTADTTPFSPSDQQKWSEVQKTVGGGLNELVNRTHNLERDKVKDHYDIAPIILDAQKLTQPEHTSDIPVEHRAETLGDSHFSSLLVKTFDDTRNEGAIFTVFVPLDATEMNCFLTSKARTVPQTVKPVQIRFSTRCIGVNEATEPWRLILEQELLLQPAQQWQEDQIIVDLDTEGFNHNRLYQFQLSRAANEPHDNLVGDWNLLNIVIKFS